MNIKWVPALIAVNDSNEPVGVLYTKNGHYPYPSPKTPPQVTQELVRMPKLDHQAHADTVRQIYEDVSRMTGT